MNQPCYGAAAAHSANHRTAMAATVVEGVDFALAIAREAGATTVLNVAPADAPSSIGLLKLADVLTPNETEFAALLARHAGQSVNPDTLARSDDDALHALCQSVQATTWVITLGGEGAFVSHASPGQRGDTAVCYRVPAAPARVVDTTGAGDAFSGALAAALAANDPGSFAEAVAFASRYAALSTETAGAALSMPRLRAR